MPTQPPRFRKARPQEALTAALFVTVGCLIFTMGMNRVQQRQHAQDMAELKAEVQTVKEMDEDLRCQLRGYEQAVADLEKRLDAYESLSDGEKAGRPQFSSQRLNSETGNIDTIFTVSQAAPGVKTLPLSRPEAIQKGLIKTYERTCGFKLLPIRRRDSK